MTNLGKNVWSKYSLLNTQTIIHFHVFIERTVCTFTVQGWRSMWTLVFHAWLVQIFLLEQTCTNSPFCTISVHKTPGVQQYSGDVWSESLSRGHAKTSQSGPHLNFVLGRSRKCIFFYLKLFFVDFLLFFGLLHHPPSVVIFAGRPLLERLKTMLHFLCLFILLWTDDRQL